MRTQEKGNKPKLLQARLVPAQSYSNFTFKKAIGCSLAFGKGKLLFSQKIIFK
jgi:hypothetical protein